MTKDTDNKARWIVSTKPLKALRGLSLIVKKPAIFVYASDNHYLTIKDNHLTIILAGYVMPRIGVFEKYNHLEQKQLIFELYQTYGLEFIHRIKGMFTLLIISKAACHIYNDRSGIRKFFYYSKKGQTVFSSDLQAIADRFSLSLNREHGALFNLLEHFVDGMTLFNEVSYSVPASHWIFSESSYNTPYWNSFDLLDRDRSIKRFDDFAWKFRDIINNYIKYFNPKNITMTLTGGNDSRTILAALLNLDVKPRGFTFGNPESYDGVVAQRIADETGMTYTNYFVSDPSAEWFDCMGSNLVSLGDSLVNIHRAHRLDSIEKELQFFPGTDMLFAGFMGGDYIKGIVYDDYITPKLLRLWEYNKVDEHRLVTELLKECSVRLKGLDLEYIIERLLRQPYFSSAKKIEREFAYVFNVVGAVHDAQDTMIFSAYIPNVVNIFMDIDFLEHLFSSPYSMINKDNSSKNQLKRLMQPALQCHTINLLAPRLSSIEFSKHYSPREFLGNKVVYAGKRLYRYFNNKKYPANFPYEKWFHLFVEEALDNTEATIENWFDLDMIKNKFHSDLHQISEKYWHPYTNIINIDRISKQFK